MKFTTIRYGVIGVFKSPAARAKIPFGGPVEGGGEGPYLVTYLSRHYGPVYVMQGKMPTFPDTFHGYRIGERGRDEQICFRAAVRESLNVESGLNDGILCPYFSSFLRSSQVRLRAAKR